MQEDGLNPEQRELERVLRSLSPTSARLDPIAAAFEAGRKVRQRQTRAWVSACVMLFLVQCASLVWMRFNNVAPWSRPVEQASIPRQLQPASAPAHPMPTLLLLENVVDKQGLDRLPTTDLPTAPAIDAKDQI